MTRNIKARLSALEAGKVELGVKARAWLGQPLTDDEKAELAAMPDDGPYVRPDERDLEGLSWEARAWLLA